VVVEGAGPVTKQVVIAAFVIAVVCCLVMWLLEDFRQRKMLSEMREWLGTLPTVGEAPPS